MLCEMLLAGARQVTAVPVSSEQTLRNLAWVEENRRKVDQLSRGRLAYIYLPDTTVAGYTFFNRYFFPQAGKEGAVVDERFNGGGSMTDYILQYLQRRLLNYRTTRDGEDTTFPVSLIPGPKALIINEYAGSGGDALPFHFRELAIGTIIGNTAGLIVVAMGTAAGTLNAMGWIATLIYLFGAAGSAYFVMTRQTELASH